jgi:hypothetical protein
VCNLAYRIHNVSLGDGIPFFSVQWIKLFGFSIFIKEFPSVWSFLEFCLDYYDEINNYFNAAMNFVPTTGKVWDRLAKTSFQLISWRMRNITGRVGNPLGDVCRNLYETTSLILIFLFILSSVRLVSNMAPFTLGMNCKQKQINKYTQKKECYMRQVILEPLFLMTSASPSKKFCSNSEK